MQAKKRDAAENLVNIRQNGVKLCRAILVATKDSPQKRTASISAP
jgi:hypothetical protein